MNGKPTLKRSMVSSMTWSRPTTEMARVIGAVAKGDLTQSVALEAEGIHCGANS